MRSLHPDSSYFAFLDALSAEQTISIALIPALLVREFPTLRAEEAKAIYADWYAQHRTRLAGGKHKPAGKRALTLPRP